MAYPGRPAYSSLGLGHSRYNSEADISESWDYSQYHSGHDRLEDQEEQTDTPRASIQIHDRERGSRPASYAQASPVVPSIAFPSNTAYDSGSRHAHSDSPSTIGAAPNLSSIYTPSQYSNSQYNDTIRGAPSPSLHHEYYGGYVDHSDTQRLVDHRVSHQPSFMSVKSGHSKYDDPFKPSHACPTHKEFHVGRLSWLSIVVFVLSLFATIFSGILLAIALAAPNWRHTVHTGGSLAPSTAAVLTTAFAKAVELASVAVFVTFLGQVLSRRAFSKTGKGMSLADMQMRAWIMQPGTMITHFETLRYAALTFLGALAITVAIMAMLYTTAAQALVTPALKFGAWESRLLYGEVKTVFANPQYLADNCKQPLPRPGRGNATDDWETSLIGNTCLQIDYAANGYHNYQQYITDWAKYLANGNRSTLLAQRPKGVGLLYENTTITGQWIHKTNTSDVSRRLKRIVNNVTLAMPHAAVFGAARNPLSDIEQPEELDGMGVYNFKAAVPSPYINVLCANAKKSEISMLVYANSSTRVANPSKDLPLAWQDRVDWGRLKKTKTPLDDVFSGKDQWDVDWPTMFYRYPKNYNTVLNNTGLWPKASVYMLGKGPPTNDDNTDPEYFVCRIRAGLTPNCSTLYTAQSSGGSLSSHCEDPNDALTYAKGSGNSSRAETINADWFNVGQEAMNALSLNNGVVDGNSSNARLLTQLQLSNKTSMDLNPVLPSPAEALCVMVGCTLILSSLNSPFKEYWNYSSTRIDYPGNDTQIQAFNASIQAQAYASGGTQDYQKAFYVVLAFIFLINVFVLIYLIFNRGLVTDYSEPPNLFSIAVNSPHNELLAGSCGGGPEGEQYKISWKVEHENDHLFIAGEMPSARSSDGTYASGLGIGDGRGKFSTLKQRFSSKTIPLDDGAVTPKATSQGFEMTPPGRTASSLLGPPSVHSPSPKLGQEGKRLPDGMVKRMYSKLSKRSSFL